MDTLKTLKGQIRDLTKISNVEHDRSALIVEKLQLLGNELITKYVIKVGDVTIEPLWVEAYYSNKNNGFEDPFIHFMGKKNKASSGFYIFIIIQMIPEAVSIFAFLYATKIKMKANIISLICSNTL